MTEVWYDLRDGAVLIGAEAAAERLDEGGPDVVPLKELITAEERIIPYTEPERQRAQDWPREKLVELGKWALALIDDDEEPIVFTYKMLDNLYSLGLGPAPRSYLHTNRFKTMRDFRISIGALPAGRPWSEFDSWTAQDFVNYARSLEERLGRKPKNYDYDNAARLSQTPAPTRKIIAEHMGSISNLNEDLGYPNIKNWNYDDYIAFGVKVAKINGTEFNRETFKALSIKGRGPHPDTVFGKSGSWEKYKIQVLEEVAKQDKEHKALVAAKLQRYRQLIDDAELDRCDSFSDEKMLCRGACFMLVKHFAPELSLREANAIARLDGSKEFIQALLRDRPSITAGTIELEAERMGIFDDIWPPEDQTEYLRVKPFTPEELEERSKERTRERRRRFHARQKARRAQALLDKKTDLDLMREAMEKLRANDPAAEADEAQPEATPETLDPSPIAIPEAPAFRGRTSEEEQQQDQLLQELERINAEITKTYEKYTAFLGSKEYNAEGQDAFFKTLEHLDTERARIIEAMQQ